MKSKAQKKTHKDTSSADAEEIVRGLRKMVAHPEKYEAHDMIYVCNLLEIGMIEAYREGRISKEKLEKFLYRDFHRDEDRSLEPYWGADPK